MTDLPSQAELTQAGLKQGPLRTAINNLRSYLAGGLGTAGTPAAMAAALGVPLSSVLTKSSAYTVTAADRGALVLASGTWSLALPVAATAGAGFPVALRNTGSGLITVDPAGSETINGASSIVVPPGHGGMLVSNGVSWAGIGTGDTAQRLPDGTAGAPGLSWANDSDTGLRRTGANDMALVAGGTDRVAVSSSGVTVSVPISGTAVTQSADDRTAGRLLKVGDHGLGAARPLTIPNAENLDDYLDMGFGVQRFTTAPVNAPWGFGSLITVPGFDHAATQIVVNRGVATPRAAIRGNADTASAAPGNWFEFFTQANALGSVSIVDDLPDGALLERGSFASGEYLRLTDGTQICWSNAITTGPAATAHGSLYRLASAATWTFPAEFASGSIVAMSGSCANLSRWPSFQHATGTVATFQVNSAVTFGGTETIHLMAAGRFV